MRFRCERELKCVVNQFVYASYNVCPCMSMHIYRTWCMCEGSVHGDVGWRSAGICTQLCMHGLILSRWNIKL